jgi:putative FmdB family regulatory protein
MPTYHYQCQQCSHQFLIQRSIKEEILTLCPECQTNSLQTIFYAVPIIDAEPKTLGGLADRNTERMGHYELQEKRQELAESKKRGRAEMDLPPTLPAGMESARNENPKAPWWRPGTSGPDLRLASLTPDQKNQYQYEGKVDG